MTALSVPQELQPAFQLLAKMDPDVFERVFSALEQTTADKLDLHFIEKLPDDTTKTVAVAISNLAYAQAAAALSSAEMVSGVVADTSEATPLSDGEKIQLADRLTRLLGLSKLIAPSKAAALVREAERIFNGCRIVTDLRPIFSDDLVTGPSTFVMTHTLKLEYREGSVGKSFFVSLDEDDIQSLREACDRAMVKARHLLASKRRPEDFAIFRQGHGEL